MTTKTQHTPGKWHVDERADDWGFIRDANGTLIASTRILDNEETIKKHRYPSTLGCPPQTLANARLLAAAPELLEALEATVGAKCWSCDYVGKISGEPCPERCDYKRFKQLIARAKGGSE